MCHSLLPGTVLIFFFKGLSVCLWTLVVENKSGIYIELMFLDVALNFGQGFIIFAIFGIDQKLLVAPLLKRWRHCLYSSAEVRPPVPEALSADTMHTCQQFIAYHMEKCIVDTVRDRKLRNKYYKQAFCGNELVDWLLIVSLAPDRAHAVKYSKHLLRGRIIRHYESQHHFHDQSLFYNFCNSGLWNFDLTSGSLESLNWSRFVSDNFIFRRNFKAHMPSRSFFFQIVIVQCDL